VALARPPKNEDLFLNPFTCGRAF